MKCSSAMTTGFKTLFILLFVAASSIPVQGAESADDQVAVVNGTVITRQDLDREITRAKNQMATQGLPVDEGTAEKMGSKILDQMIDMEILVQEGQKQKIEVSDKSVDEHLAKFKAQFKTTEAYEKALKDLNITEADLKEKTKRGLIVQALMEKQVISKIKISDEDSRRFYDENPDYFKQPEQVQASHILIKSNDDDDKAKKEAALKKIKEIQAKVKSGEDFATLAKEYSEGPSGKNGGDLGYFGPGQMVKPFEDAAFALEPGQVSDIVTTRFGHHLIMVTGKKEAKTIPYEEAKEKIDTFLKQKETNESIKKYVEALKKEAKIETSL